MTDYLDLEEVSCDTGFHITDDATADWAIRITKAEYAESDRLVQLAEARIEALKEQIKGFKQKADNNTAYLRSELAGYFTKVPTKETKTQRTYQLLSGKLVEKKSTIEYERNDSALCEWLEANGYESFVETEKKPKWGEFKRQIVYDGEDGAIDKETGCKVDGLTAVEKPGKFEVK